MNCQQANQIPFIDILYKQGFKESYTRNNKGIIYYWFLSPFREEKTPSFSLDTEQNKFKDWGSGEHGNVVDYMVLYYKSSVRQILMLLDSFDFSSFQKQKINHSNLLNKKEELNYEILEVKNQIENSNLKKYLNRRKINEAYWKYLREVHFKLNDKIYYSVGFENDSKGYELSWEYWNKTKQTFVRQKMCLLVKDVSFIKNGAESVVILESWSDFLSLLTLYPKMESKNDFIIMNSVSIKIAVYHHLDNHRDQYRIIYSATDNDSAGRVILSDLLFMYPDKVISLNEFYKNFKDVGELLVSK